MSGLYEAASAIMRLSQQRIDIVSHNVANTATPGYKRQTSAVRFSDLANAALDVPIITPQPFVTEQGKLTFSGNALDLAVSGTGYFVLKRGDLTAYSRAGQFHRDEDGRVVDAQGFALQQAGGGDLILERTAVAIDADGTVLDAGRPVARIALASPEPGQTMARLGETHFTAADGAMAESDAVIRQGMLESSNVSMTDEMVTMMAALRQAESGARLMQTYDELLGQAVDILGRGGK